MQPGQRLGLTRDEMRARLDAFARRYDRRFLDSDPLGIVRRFDRPEDRELIGLLAAGLAYGRVDTIRSSVCRLLAVLGSRPSRFLEGFDPARDARRFEGFRHRFTSGRDVARYLGWIRRAREMRGSIEAFFVDHDRDPESQHLGPAMDAFADALFALDGEPGVSPEREKERAGARWLLPRPRDGSACKRHCLFLRWMVRPEDGLDCGIWKRVSPARLVVPLDTHIERLARALGWSRRRSPSWAMAVEVTEMLKRLDPGDPTRYDFALSRLGILGLLRARGGRLAPRDVAAALDAPRSAAMGGTATSKRLHDGSPRLGAHMSIAGGMPLAVERAASVGATALQVFVKSSNQWAARPFLSGETEAFRVSARAAGLDRHTVAHASYLVNLASPDDALWRRSLEAMREEMERCSALGIPLLVVHPGSHVGAGVEEGLRRVVRALDACFGAAPVKGLRPAAVARGFGVLLEVTAGQGSNLGSTFEEIAWVLGHAVSESRLGVCFDTCHALASGYEFRDARSYRETFEAFDRIVGIGRLRAFHLNDSKGALGSRLDRHEHIGRGQVGLEAFRLILGDRRFRGLPMLLETPKGEDLREDRENLAILRELVGR